MQVPLIYHRKPLFGFDLGARTAKMIQLQPSGKHLRVLGYGYADIPTDTIVEGILVDPDTVAKALKPLLKQMSYGHINATRVAVSLPASKVFTRSLELPPMSDEDLVQAVNFEAEQYIPVPLPDLYIDYEIQRRTAEHIDVLIAAAPRAIVDSYLRLFDLLGLELSHVESSLTSVVRSMAAGGLLYAPTIVADFGAPSLDLTIYDQGIRSSNTVDLGGDDLTATLERELGLTASRANQIKAKYGLGNSGLQPKVLTALEPQLSKIVSEIKRVQKYYSDRNEDKKQVERLIITGGSAAMPGLVEYLSEHLGLPTELGNPWAGLELKGIQGVIKTDIPLYATAIGLARLEAIDD